MTPQELRAARKRLDMTQQEFADEIAMSYDSVKSMESGRRPIEPRTEKLVRAMIGEKAMSYTYEAIYYVSEFKNDSYESTDLEEIINFSRAKANETKIPVHVMEMDEETGMDREVMLVYPKD